MQMLGLSLGLLAVAVSDLLARPAAALVGRRESPRSAGRARVVQVVGGLLVLLAAAWGFGLFGGDGLPVLLVLGAAAALVVGWQVTQVWGSDRPAAPLAVLGVGVVALLLLGPGTGASGGAVDRWPGWQEWGDPQQAWADTALLVLALALLQLSTANVVVRLVLRAVDINPPESGDRNALQGGRVLGPMERLLILGLGLAGEVTAATVVVAAKGLIRWPELSRARSAPASDHPFASDPEPASIHDVTEYFLVGSFVSWLFALGSLALVHLG